MPYLVLGRYFTATLHPVVGQTPLMRRSAPALATLALLAAAPAADAASRLVITGGGFGHGVGMSQYGTLGFAQKGKGYREILGHYYTGTQVARLSSTPTVRVLVQSNKGTVSFNGAAQAGDRRLQPGSTYRAQAYAGNRVVLKTASGRKLRTLPAPLRVVGPSGRAIDLAGAGAYRGAFELRPAQFGGLNAINAVDLESYVRGVVSAESPSSWPAEALKTQAVAARTYAITTNKPGAGFDHYPDTRSQVYRGVAAETRTTDAAVGATNGEVVTYRGKPVVTYFFSTSGGRTENSEYGFPGGEAKPWLKSVADPYDSVSPRHKWGPYRYTMAGAGAKLRGLVKGRFLGIEVTQRGASPRVVKANVIGTNGATAVDGPTLRRRFGLYDSWAYFTVVDTEAKAEREPADEGASDPGTGGTGARAASARRGGTISGRLYGVKKGAAVRIERRTNAGVWRTEVRTHVGKGRRYSAAVSRTGVYRVVVRGVTGPAVRLR
jgi:stage II sporulation protein D